MPSTRSEIPVIAARPRSGDRPAGGFASYRVRPMNSADAKNDAALIANATSRPSATVISPPIDAPTASMADHVALESALAGNSSSDEVMLGIVAVRAGSKKAEADTVSAMTR